MEDLDFDNMKEEELIELAENEMSAEEFELFMKTL